MTKGSPIYDRLLALLTGQPVRVNDLAAQLSCTRTSVDQEVAFMRRQGLVVPADMSGTASLTAKGLNAQTRLLGEACVFPPDFQAPAVSIMLRLKQAGWEGQVFVDGERHHLPISSSISELAQAAETFLQERT